MNIMTVKGAPRKLRVGAAGFFFFFFFGFSGCKPAALGPMNPKPDSGSRGLATFLEEFLQGGLGVLASGAGLSGAVKFTAPTCSEALRVYKPPNTQTASP